MGEAPARKRFKTEGGGGGGHTLHNMALCCLAAFMSRPCYCKRVGSKRLVVFFRSQLPFKYR